MKIHPQLRSATPDDALCVGVLAMQVFLDTYATEGIRPQLAREVLAHCAPEAFASRIACPRTAFVLAEHAGHLVGFAELTATDQVPLDGLLGGVELVRLYVQRPFQQRGVGRLLLQRAEALAGERGGSLLWLTAWSGNHRAQAFYRALGYADVGATQYLIEGQGYENRIFSKRLPP